MLTDKYIEIKISKRNLNHFSKYYENLSLKDIIRVKPYELQPKSNKKVNVKCDICDIRSAIKYQAYTKNINSSNEHPIYTCVKCSHIKLKSTNLKKYGVDYYSKTEEYSTKFKSTMKERYNAEYSTQSKEIYDKIKNTILNKYGVDNIFKDNNYIKKKFKEKYGVEHPSNLKSIYDKIEESNLKSTGYKSPLSSPEIRKNITTTNNKLYGSDTPAQSNEIRDYIITKDKNHIQYIGNNVSLFKCDLGKNHSFKIKCDNYHGRTRGNISLCTICNPISSTSSIKEKELYEFIKSIYNGEIKRCYKSNRKEIDIFLKELNLGFEFNGLYWHSEEYKDKNYHIDKTKYFKNKGIRIIHIWEDDWINKKDIIQSQIKNWLGLIQDKIYARKCIVKEITDIKTVRNFLDNNHIQGFTISNKKLGLYYNNELVSIMLFDKNEGRKKMNNNQWNLSRFCNVLNTNVIGGASKLLKNFIRTYNPDRIISYADRDWSEGDIYYKLGFSNIKISNPDYKYILENRRVHKSRFRNSRIESDLTEKEYTKKNNIKRIWDCGKIKFEMIL